MADEPSATTYPRILFDEAAKSLPTSTPQEKFDTAVADRGTLVVLDDVPTGTQTVHDITVLTTFDKEVLIDQFNSKEPGFFILTNTRAFHHDEVARIVHLV